MRLGTTSNPASQSALLAALCGVTLVLAGGTSLHAQGCVAARGAGMTCSAHDMEEGETSKFEANVTYRWFKSGKHFTGTHEDIERQEEGSQVINRSHFVDFNFTYTFNPRVSATLAVPYVSHDRSQVVRKNDPQRTILERFSTQSDGLGDVRATAGYWLLNPGLGTKGNVLIGAGLALPTGKKDVRDTFHVYNAATGQIDNANRTVDQSIQPGTGGYGIIAEIYAYRVLTPSINLFVNGAYTATPQEKNGVPTYRSNPYEAEMSIADTYMARVGVDGIVPSVQGFGYSLAARIEGVPVKDIVGGSNGFRRPGFSIAVEPGVSYSANKWSVRLYVPVAVARQRQRSVADVQQSAATGRYSHGDAAFADYLVMTSVSRRF